MGNLRQIGVKVKNLSNHHLVDEVFNEFWYLTNLQFAELHRPLTNLSQLPKSSTSADFVTHHHYIIHPWQLRFWGWETDDLQCQITSYHNAVYWRTPPKHAKTLTSANLKESFPQQAILSSSSSTGVTYDQNFVWAIWSISSISLLAQHRST